MSRTKSWVFFSVLCLLMLTGLFALLVKSPEAWRPLFLAKARSISVLEASIGRENPFRTLIGPNTYVAVDSSEASDRDYLIPGDFDQVVAMAKKELSGWSIEMVPDGPVQQNSFNVTTQTMVPGPMQKANSMDQQFMTDYRGVKIYRRQVGNATRVRVWQRHPKWINLPR